MWLRTGTRTLEFANQKSRVAISTITFYVTLELPSSLIKFSSIAGVVYIIGGSHTSTKTFETWKTETFWNLNSDRMARLEKDPHFWNNAEFVFGAWSCRGGLVKEKDWYFVLDINCMSEWVLYTRPGKDKILLSSQLAKACPMIETCRKNLAAPWWVLNKCAALAVIFQQIQSFTPQRVGPFTILCHGPPLQLIKVRIRATFFLPSITR